MSKQDQPIYLNYNFKNPNYQSIFYGHIIGTTFTIGATFKPKANSKGEITEMEGDFISKNMGGLINLALRDVEDVILFDTNSSDSNTDVHLLEVKLNMNTNTDADFDPIKLKFQKPFNRKKGILRVRIENEQIINLVPGMLTLPKKEIDDDRSCNTKLGDS